MTVRRWLHPSIRLHTQLRMIIDKGIFLWTARPGPFQEDQICRIRFDSL